MDLIKLADELSFDDIAEILARKLLSQEQALCRRLIDAAVDELDKRPFRNALANAQALAERVRETGHDNSFHFTLADSVNDKVAALADEYTRLI